ncbi:MAG: 2-hydroxyacid dehydrogenase [Rhizobiaceae bacterium]
MFVSELSDVTVLIPGRLNDHAAERIKRTFAAQTLVSADPGKVDPAFAQNVLAIAAMTTISASFIDCFPKLEIIANFGVGYDAVDARHAASKGVIVTNTPDVLTDEVADTAIGLLLNTLREFPRAETWLRDGRWVRDGAYPLTNLTLRGRRVGIFGMGRIGKAIARRLEAFGVSVAYHNRRPLADVDHDYHPSLIDLATNVDTLISVAPGGASTEKAVNAEVLRALGPHGVFVNIGRGSTVDEPALVEALRSKTIAAAGLDVFMDEPRVPQALVDLPNACLLPHVGSASIHTRRAMADLVVDNLISWFSGKGAISPVPESAGLPRSR